MSSDKRRRARVQGGWAAPSSKPASAKPVNRDKLPAAPAWLANTVDVPKEKSSSFTYQQPTEEIREKPPTKMIDKPGVYDLSLGPSGVSRIRLFYNFLDPNESDEIYSDLFSGLPWQQKYNAKYHSAEHPAPLQRLTAWFGEIEYIYSGVKEKANTKWPVVLRRLQERLEENTGLRFNSVLCNLYRDCKDSVDWHADDEPVFRENPTIASISLGDSRNFDLKKRAPSGSLDDKYAEEYRVPLPSGSLLIMEGSLQADWLHRVPKEYHDRWPRINLTFRKIYPSP